MSGEKPPPVGSVSLQLNNLIEEKLTNFVVIVKGETVPIWNMRLIVVLPEKLIYRPGSGTVDSASLTPDQLGSALTFRLGDGPADWEKSVRFQVEIDDHVTSDAVVKAILLFDTAVSKNLSTPPAEIAAKNGEHSSDIMTIEVEGQFAAKTPDSPADIKPKQYDKNWLETAQPGVAWLEPEEGHLPPIPSLNFVIKHRPKHKLTLLLEGVKIGYLNFDSVATNSAGTVAVSRWRGIDLLEGDNQFELIVMDTEGREVEHLLRMFHYSGPPVKAEFMPSKSILVADGKTVPEIAIRLTDKDGYPAREGVIGEFSVDPPYEAYQETDALDKFPLTGPDQRRPRYVVGKDGVALLRLEPTPGSGEVVIRPNLSNDEHEIRAWLEPGLREWILVGLADGTVGYNTIHSHMEDLHDNEHEEQLYEDGRIAFFAKGKIKGTWLMTVAYDNAKRKTKDGRESLHQIIDPDSFYTLYGDNSHQDYDAASARKLYVKIERNAFYAVFGDYDTGLTVTELSRYSRSLNGLKTEYHGNNLSLKGFASDTSQAFVKDEIRGDGTSGLYSLSRRDLVLNSEKVTIEVRDRFHSEVVLSSEQLARHVDYNIDYDDGTLYFKRPIMSKDANLDPIFIVVDYEANDSDDESFNYGGRVAVKLMDQRLEIGASHIHEGRVGGDGNLYGLDLTHDFSEATTFTSEIARTETDFAGVDSDGSAYIAELSHRSSKLDGLIYIREQDSDFGLGQQNGSETGTRKLGIEADYRINERLNLDGEVYRQLNLGTDARRDVMETALTYTGDSLSLGGGFLRARDKETNGTVRRSDQLHARTGYAMFNQRLHLNLDHYQSLNGKDDSSDFPTRTIFGTDYQLNKFATLVAAYEITDGENESSQSARFGIDSRPWQGGKVNTTVEQQIREDGRRAFANFGLYQTLQVNETWSVDAGLDMTETVQSPGNTVLNENVPPASGSDDDFVALSLGANRRNAEWNWASRVERRMADSEDKWGLFTGVIGEVRPRLSMSLSAELFDTKAKFGQDSFSSDIRLGLAYRPA